MKDGSLFVFVGDKPSCLPEFFDRRQFTGHSHSPAGMLETNVASLANEGEYSVVVIASR